MRLYEFCLGFCLLILILFANSYAEEDKSLAEIYKSGSVSFIPVQTIGEETMPKTVFFEGAVAVVTDENENVYICDYKANNIKKFDKNGEFIKTIGRKGQGPGEFNMPFNIAVMSDKLFVYDMGNFRLCALKLDGEFIKSAGFQMDQGRPQLMRASPDGNLMIGLEKTNFRETDKPQDYLINAYSAELKSSGSVYSQQIWHNKYLRHEGRLTNVIQPFAPLVYWDVTPDGKIVIGKSDKYEIHIYTKDGEKTHTFVHTYKPVKVTDKDKDIFFGNVAYSSGGGVTKGAPDHIKKNTEFPKYKPAFRQILVDSEGNVLVCTYREERDEDLKYFDAFDPQGDFLGSVRINSDIPFPFRAKIKNHSFWWIQSDEDGINKVVKYRITE